MMDSLPKWMGDLFPAPAGMILATAILLNGTKPFPRTRGDDPVDRNQKAFVKGFSPHPRG